MRRFFIAERNEIILDKKAFEKIFIYLKALRDHKVEINSDFEIFVRSLSLLSISRQFKFTELLTECDMTKVTWIKRQVF